MHSHLSQDPTKQSNAEKLEKVKQKFKESVYYSRDDYANDFQQLIKKELEKHKITDCDRNKLPPKRKPQIALVEQTYQLLPKLRIDYQDYSEALYNLERSLIPKATLTLADFQKAKTSLIKEWPAIEPTLQKIAGYWDHYQQLLHKAQTKAKTAEAEYEKAKQTERVTQLKSLMDRIIKLETDLSTRIISPYTALKDVIERDLNTVLEEVKKEDRKDEKGKDTSLVKQILTTFSQEFNLKLKQQPKNVSFIKDKKDLAKRKKAVEQELQKIYSVRDAKEKELLLAEAEVANYERCLTFYEYLDIERIHYEITYPGYLLKICKPKLKFVMDEDSKKEISKTSVAQPDIKQFEKIYDDVYKGINKALEKILNLQDELKQLESQIKELSNNKNELQQLLIKITSKKKEMTAAKEAFDRLLIVVPNKSDMRTQKQYLPLLKERILRKLLENRVHSKFERKKDQIFIGAFLYVQLLIQQEYKLLKNKSTLYHGIYNVLARDNNNQLTTHPHLTARFQQKCLSLFRDFALQMPELFENIPYADKDKKTKFITAKKIADDIPDYHQAILQGAKLKLKKTSYISEHDDKPKKITVANPEEYRKIAVPNPDKPAEMMVIDEKMRIPALKLQDGNLSYNPDGSVRLGLENRTVTEIVQIQNAFKPLKNIDRDIKESIPVVKENMTQKDKKFATYLAKIDDRQLKEQPSKVNHKWPFEKDWRISEARKVTSPMPLDEGSFNIIKDIESFPKNKKLRKAPERFFRTKARDVVLKDINNLHLAYHLKEDRDKTLIIPATKKQGPELVPTMGEVVNNSIPRARIYPDIYPEGHPKAHHVVMDKSKIAKARLFGDKKGAKPFNKEEAERFKKELYKETKYNIKKP